MDEINVEEIMKELKKKAAEQKIEREEQEFDKLISDGICEDMSYIEKFDRDDFIFELTEVNRYFWVNPDIAIEEKGFLKKNLKKVIKKLVQFISYPLVEKQNEFNQVATRAFNQIRNYIVTHDNVDKRVEELQFIIEKEVLKSMRLYSEEYQKMSLQYEKLYSMMEEHEKNEKRNRKKVMLLEQQMELLEQQLQMEKGKNKEQ